MSIILIGRLWVLAAALALTLPVSVACAADEHNIDENGVAIHGYDPVAYFHGEPAKGRGSLHASHRGAVYWFESLQNRELFIQAPEKYAPAYGGWCSYGVRVGKKFDADPHAWVIAENRLFLQLDLGTQKVWAQDRARNISIADRLWPNIASTPAGLLDQ